MTSIFTRAAIGLGSLLTNALHGFLGFGLQTEVNESFATLRTLSWGSGAPTKEEPNGSIWIRLDASSWSTAIYQRRSGAWVALGNYGSTGLSTDVIAESTSGSGVTVDGTLIKDGKVAKLSNTTGWKISAEFTGTGSAVDVAHGLTGTPTGVIPFITELPSGLGSGADITVGAIAATTVSVQATADVKYRLLSFG